MLKGFQNWAAHTNSDIGLVSDNGAEFGVPGSTHSDFRFGDIRVGAVPLDEALFAVNIAFDEVLDGTWAGELLFNSNAEIDSVADILAIAAHEAGNIFGLEDSSDPLSPLYDLAIPTVTEPTTTDVADLQAIHGAPIGDVFDIGEFDVGDLGFIELRTFESAAGVAGAVPSIAFGKISSATELDVFEHQFENGDAQPVTVQVITTGISQLAPSLTVKDQNGNLLHAETLDSSAGDDITLSLNPPAEVSSLVVEVGTSATDTNAVGGYSLVVQYDLLNDPDSFKSVDRLVHYPQRMIEIHDLREYFEDGEQLLANDDFGADDTPGAELILESAPGFVEGTRYQIIASIESSGDVDRYLVSSPEALPGGFEMALVSIQATETNRLNGQVSVFDSGGVRLAAEVLVHNDEQMIVQFPLMGAEETFVIEVAADSEAPNSVGTYEMVAQFGTAPINRDTFLDGQLIGFRRARTHQLRVDRPQLFQFIFATSGESATNDSLIEFSIKDRNGVQVLQLATRVGDTRSNTVLLASGEYTLTVRVASRGLQWSPVDYQLSGAAVDDPLGPGINDPTEDQYEFDSDRKAFFFAVFFPF